MLPEIVRIGYEVGLYSSTLQLFVDLGGVDANLILVASTLSDTDW